MKTGEIITLRFEPIGDHWRRGGCKVIGWRGDSIRLTEEDGVIFASKSFLHDFGVFYLYFSLDSMLKCPEGIECFAETLYGLKYTMRRGPTLFIKCIMCALSFYCPDLGRR